MGNGWYSKHLSYKDWLEFNSAQRTFLNFLEQITTITVLLLVAGLKHPECTFYIGVTYFVCRLLYVVLYKVGPNMRFPVVGVILILLISLLYLSIDSALSFGTVKVA